MLDPICDMVVSVAEAAAKGRTVEHEGRTYAFCSNGCVKAFRADPVNWAAKADAAIIVSALRTGGPVENDLGMRRWDEARRCCLHRAEPQIGPAPGPGAATGPTH